MRVRNEIIILCTTLALVLVTSINSFSLINYGNSMSNSINGGLISKSGPYIYTVDDDNSKEIPSNIELPISQQYSSSHEGIPNGILSNDYKYRPRINFDGPFSPANWKCINLWCTSYLEEGKNYYDNVGIRIQNPKIWIFNFNTKKWVLLADKFEYGKWYLENFYNDGNSELSDTVRWASDKSWVEIKQTNVTKGRCFHPWTSQINWKDNSLINTNNTPYIITQADFKLIKYNNNGPDNLSKASLLVNVGADWWRKVGDVWQSDWSTNRDVAIGKYLKATTNLRRAYCTNLPENWKYGLPEDISNQSTSEKENVDSYNIWKETTKSTKIKKIATNAIKSPCINVKDGWLYYIGVSSQGGLGIYKVKTDGTNGKKLTTIDNKSLKNNSEYYNNMVVVENYIYYTDGTNKIKRINTSGSNEKTVYTADGYISSFTMSSKNIYVKINHSSNTEIYRINESTGNSTKIISKNINDDITNLVYYNDYLFYISQGKTLCRCTTSGQNTKTIIKDMGNDFDNPSFYIYNKKIYYLKDGNLRRCNLDGTYNNLVKQSNYPYITKCLQINSNKKI